MIDVAGMKVKEIKEIIDVEIGLMQETLEYKNLTDLMLETGKDSRSAVKKLSLKCGKAIMKQKNEVERVRKLYEFDVNMSRGLLIAGVDEVGRGPLAGPIVAAAVVLDYSKLNDKDLILYINDSKKIKEAKREELFDIIKECALDYMIAIKDNDSIDDKGISWCNNEIFKESILGLDIKPDRVLCDGYAIKDFNVDSEAVIKGDTKSAAIACASILAKVYRDRIMKEYSKEFPQYDFASNVGYGTAKHIEGLREFGPVKIHRKSFIKNLI